MPRLETRFTKNAMSRVLSRKPVRIRLAVFLCNRQIVHQQGRVGPEPLPSLRDTFSGRALTPTPARSLSISVHTFYEKEESKRKLCGKKGKRSQLTAQKERGNWKTNRPTFFTFFSLPTLLLTPNQNLQSKYTFHTTCTHGTHTHIHCSYVLRLTT